MHRVFTGPLTVERVQVAIAGLPNSLQGLRLVQLSDFHFDGVSLSQDLLDQAIALSNAADPDLVILTGDFITDDHTPIHALAKQLNQLQSRSGAYAVLGNHDICYRNSKTEVTQALQQNNIAVLWNEIAYPVGAQLPLVGLADYWSTEFRPANVMPQLDPNLPRLVLCHNPDTAEFLAQWRVDLQLSGHTHGGQVCIPGVGNMAHHISRFYRSLPRKVKRRVPMLKECAQTMRHWEWSQGLHQVGQNQLYVNRGLGTYAPGRFFCPPELTVLTLQQLPVQ
jgi:uncharacterized protein